MAANTQTKDMPDTRFTCAPELSNAGRYAICIIDHNYFCKCYSEQGLKEWLAENKVDYHQGLLFFPNVLLVDWFLLKWG